MRQRFWLLLAAATPSWSFFLMSVDRLVAERIDPLINPGGVSGHAHFIYGASAFGPNAADGDSTQTLLASKCHSIPIKQDASNYWHPMLASSALRLAWRPLDDRRPCSTLPRQTAPLRP
jgi:hypothetical protein